MKSVATGIFAGRTAIITGGSRGIGKEIALKLAKNGANVVIAAKTAEPHPKLPGTIHSTVEELEKIGGKGLACMMDVRDEKSVETTVQKALEKFGTIDILVNNASAITLTGTVETQMKKYDLMNQINARGTFMMSQKCIPHLKNGKNPHILNISPPLVMEEKWFANHVAYTMAKFGMSMCVLGMSQELKPLGIGVNALWPKTAIWTEAMKMLYGEPVASRCRKPAIMADAAHLILSRNSHNYTGNFAIDEEILAGSGVTDFEQYAMVPGKPLMPDFFLPAKYFADFNQLNEVAKKQQAQQCVDITEDINRIRKIINKDLVKEIDAVYRFNLENGDKVQKVYIDLKNGDGEVYQSVDDKEVDATLTTAVAEFREIFAGKLSPEVAFVSGKLKIDGRMGKVMLLSKLIR